MWTTYQLAIAVGMVTTGSINTLAVKWADEQCAPGPGGTPPHHFQHPFLQAFCMFVGEFSCLVVFRIWLLYMKNKGRTDEASIGNQNFNPFLFLLPATCDMTATSLMYIALNYTYTSSFQILRGAIIVFTALLSVGFLRRSIRKKSWLGIFCVIVGLTLIGVSDVIFPDVESEHGPNEILTGDLIIIIAQAIQSVQAVVEEKFVSGKNIHPLQAVGWEGVFGMTVLGVLLIPMYWIPAGEFSDNPRGVLEDAPDGLYQMGHNSILALAQIGSICSIAFFNFFGISVTKELSATTRMILDTVRTFVIWAVSLIARWQDFQYIEVIGFIVLLLGTAIYNNLVPVPCLETPSIAVVVNSDPAGYDNDDADEKAPILNNTQKSDEDVKE